MRELVRLIAEDQESDHSQEWLVANGLGGYAFGTISGVLTRAYHGYLIAALPAPLGRMMMLNDIVEQVQMQGDRRVQLGGDKRTPPPFQTSFRLEMGLPVWSYSFDGVSLEKRVLMPHGQNTVFVIYRLLSDHSGLRLTLRPSVQFRAHNATVNLPLDSRYVLTVAEDQYEVCSGNDLPPLRLQFFAAGGALTVDRIRIQP